MIHTYECLRHSPQDYHIYHENGVRQVFSCLRYPRIEIAISNRRRIVMFLGSALQNKLFWANLLVYGSETGPQQIKHFWAFFS